MHTPRLCIDGRAAIEFDTQGFIAQELIDQLVSAQGDPSAASDWVEQKRAVLLTHPDQVFSGQLKRFDTRKRIGSSFFYWAWEKHFVENANISAFHRFRPADRLEPVLSCPTITTVLPPRRGLGASHIAPTPNHRFVVPSETDKATLQRCYGLSDEKIVVALPNARRYVHFAEQRSVGPDGPILLLVDGSKGFDLKKLEAILGSQYPHLPTRTLNLNESRKFSPKGWSEILQHTSLCFYLTEQAFDWPFLALEALYYDVPVIFMDNHPALSEMLPLSPLTLSRYLTHFLTSTKLKTVVSEARAKIQSVGGFDEHSLARQYRDIYSDLMRS